MRVGIDLTSVDDVRAAIEAHGDRYLQRVYAPGELADCGGDPARLAARFAAKEAAVKVLRPTEHPLPWISICVRRHSTGYPELVLMGLAARQAAAEGLTELALSLTHEGDHAAAVVVAH